jgi:threonylcarbamoyladenosine tRNA methylthiotransferase CDKAL1
MRRSATAQEVKKRTRRLNELFQGYHPYAKRMGKRYSILVTDTSHDGRFYVGHNEFYEQVYLPNYNNTSCVATHLLHLNSFQVLVPKDPELMGKLVEVEVVNTCKFSMTGKVISEKDLKTPALAKALEKGAVSGVAKPAVSGAATASSWVYQFSVIILALAIFVRLAQLLLMANKTKTVAPEATGGGAASAI